MTDYSNMSHSEIIRHAGDLEENLLSVATAAQLDLRDLNRVRRDFVPRIGRGKGLPRQHQLYSNAYWHAVGHMRRAGNALRPAADAQPTLGVFAASVALHRLRTTLFSAHFLYQLRLVLEGDVIARQMLEQIAWANAAAEATTHGELEKIKSERAIGGLKRVFPAAGPLNGVLSASAHAGIALHREHTSVGDDGRLLIKRGLDAWSHCASVIMFLSDAAVTILERTQRDHMSTFIATDPDNGFAYVENNPYKREGAEIIEELVAIEGEGRDAD